MQDDLLYQLALTEVPTIGHVHAKILAQQFGNAKEIFLAKQSLLEKIEGIGEVRARAIKAFADFSSQEKEIKFILRNNVQALFITDAAYPKRLLNCYDSPTLLFMKGNADLNTSKIISIIGTRSHTAYGKQVTEKMVKDLAHLQPIIVSGLAFGIDAITHKAAVKNKVPTIGVLAHGLDQMYPQEHAGLAREMLQGNGGLLTEHRSNTKADKHHFPVRNRIVAGISDAIVVVESGIKGGSMITAELANGYNKDVFAFPGRVSDTKSSGCNQLIRGNKAILLTDAQELIDVMGWEEKQRRENRAQREIFIELTKDERIIVDMLNEKPLTHIDEINIRSGLSNSAVAAAILNLELQSVVGCQPGKLYRLI
jgi:DNA processing protein